MLMNTHVVIGKNIIKNIEDDKKFMIRDTNFLWGNIKPDIASKYKFKKHYMDESFDMVIGKIDYLSKLTLDDINGWFSISRFNQQLGVVCHFLSDFFCTPHSERWEFSHSMNKHIKYERELSSFAKSFIDKNDKYKLKDKEDFREFLMKLHKEYKGTEEFSDDMIFSAMACNTIVDYILDSVIINSKLKAIEGKKFI